MLEPEARSRRTFAFHRPETLGAWLMEEAHHPGSTVRARLKHLPQLITDNLWPARVRAIRGPERAVENVTSV